MFGAEGAYGFGVRGSGVYGFSAEVCSLRIWRVLWVILWELRAWGLRGFWV